MFKIYFHVICECFSPHKHTRHLMKRSYLGYYQFHYRRVTLYRYLADRYRYQPKSIARTNSISSKREQNAYDKLYKGSLFPGNSSHESDQNDSLNNLQSDLNDELSLGEYDYTEGESLQMSREFPKMEILNQQAFIRKKIIERKYFRADKGKNILSWSAKQQIKYLNSEFPDEWTVEKLKETFPVSREVIRSILKSTYDLTESERIRHDERVKENVESLSEEEREELGLQRLENVTAIKGLPQPALREPSNRCPGQFESIITKYNKAVERLEHGLEKANRESTYFGELGGNKTESNTRVNTKVDAIRSNSAVRASNVERTIDTRCLNATHADPRDIANSGRQTQKRRARRERRTGRVGVTGDNLEDMGMAGTFKSTK